jgi:DNA repair exonuclease SbcCD ATPase subunit
MQVIINNFKCYEHKEITFPKSGLTLLSGLSGAGKSTVFQAIYWCLYGNKAIKSVQPWSNPKTKDCYVQLVFDDNNWSCLRQKNPERFTVTTESGQTLTAQSAEDYICNKYGAKEIWLPTSYLQQNTRSIMVYGTSAEKSALIERLVFADEPPSKLISKLNEERKKFQAQFELTHSEYEYAYNKLAPKLDVLNKYNVAKYTASKQTKIASKLDTLTKQNKELVLLQEKYIKTNIKFIHVSDIICNLESKLKQISTDTDYIETSENILKQLEKQIQNAKHYETLDTRITELSKHIETEYQTITQEQFDSFLKQNASYTESKAICDDIDIEYDEEKINEYISYIEFVLPMYADLKQLKMLNKLVFSPDVDTSKSYSDEEIALGRVNNEKRLKSVQICIKYGLEYTEANVKLYNESLINQNLVRIYQRWLKSDKGKFTEQEEIQNLEYKLMCLEQQKNILECPCCHSKLYLDSTNKLNEYKNTIIKQNVSEINILTSQIKQKKDDNIKYQIASQLQNQIEAYKGDISKLLLINETSTEQLVYIEQNIDHVTMKQHNLTVDKIKTRKSLSEQFENISSDYMDEILSVSEEEYTSKLYMMKQIKIIEPLEHSIQIYSKWFEQGKYKSTYDKLIKEQAQLDKPKCTSEQYQFEYNQLKTFVTTYEQIQKELDNYKFQIETISGFKDYSQELTEIEETITSYQTYLNECIILLPIIEEYQQLNTLYQKVCDLETKYKSFQRLTELAKILEHQILEQNINTIYLTMNEIMMCLFDTPIQLIFSLFRAEHAAIETTLCYKGCKENNIQSLSGGECDRVSLAIIAALSLLSPFPYLFLDECFGALDSDTKEKCLESLRQFIGPTKSIVLISHEDTEGYYDTVIKF